MLQMVQRIYCNAVLALGEDFERLELRPSDETLDRIAEATRTLHQLGDGYTVCRTDWRVDHASPVYRMVVKETEQGFEACIEYEFAEGELYTVKRFGQRQQAVDFAVAY